MLLNYLIPLLIIFQYNSPDTNSEIPIGLIETPLGNIYIQFHDQTPEHKESFIQLAEAGYWDSLTFNRVIPNFVAQGGCPDTEEGFTDPDYLLEPELVSELTHVYGAVGAGRDDNPGKVSASCQFYIVQNPKGLHRLDGDYTIFGQVIKGMDVIHRIVAVPRSEDDTPTQPITMTVRIIHLDEKEVENLKKGDIIL